MLKLVTVRVGMSDDGVSIHTTWTSVCNGCLDDRLTVRGEAVEELADCCFFPRAAETKQTGKAGVIALV